MPWIGIFLKVIITFGAILLFLGIGALLEWLIFKKLKVKADREHTIKLVNTGNCRSNYYFWVESAQQDLSFEFLHNSVPLAPAEEIIEEAAISEAVQSVPDQKKNGRSSSVKLTKAAKAGQTVAEKSGAAAGMLGALGGIIPGEVGAKFGETAKGARDIQAGTAKATQAPKAMERKVDSFAKSGKKLGVSSEKLGVQQNKVTIQDQPLTSNSVSRAERKFKKVVLKSGTGAIKVRSMDADPGEALNVTLRIGTKKKRYPTGSFSYSVWSQQVPTEEKFEKADPVVNNGLVSFKPIGSWRYLLPGFCGALLALLIIVSMVSVIPLIWG